MKKWIVEAGDLVMGIYEGEDERGALDKYAQDAGYESFSDLQKQVPGDVRVRPLNLEEEEK